MISCTGIGTLRARAFFSSRVICSSSDLRAAKSWIFNFWMSVKWCEDWMKWCEDWMKSIGKLEWISEIDKSRFYLWINWYYYLVIAGIHELKIKFLHLHHQLYYLITCLLFLKWFKSNPDYLVMGPILNFKFLPYQLISIYVFNIIFHILDYVCMLKEHASKIRMENNVE